MTDDRWRQYYDNTAGRPPRPTLMFALDRFAAPGIAVDLGCGDGRDTVEMLRRGWTVLAIDSEEEALQRLAARPDLSKAGRLDTMQARFEDASWPQADLVNASFSLFFCAERDFAPLWPKIVASLKPGGRFAGQLLGPRDSWIGRRNVVYCDDAELDRLIGGLAVEKRELEETDSVTPRGESKHWHIHHLVLRKG
jgi:tellurite methyltransferase